MCNLCGVLGGGWHWSETHATPEAFENRNEIFTKLRERQERSKLINLVLEHYKLSITDWAGNAYLLKTKTGQTSIVNNVTEIWSEAERLSRRKCDPLDDSLLRAVSKQQ